MYARLLSLTGLAACMFAAGPMQAQTPPGVVTVLVAVTARQLAAQPFGSVIRLDALNVTATRTTRDVFSTPVPIAVIGGTELRESGAASTADHFRRLAGLDVEGVGPGRQMPVLRGLRGQRVLFLEDGLRLNQPRRRLDSGEPAALTGVEEPDRVEVIRGPASVLYGSDALGGAVNVVSRRAPLDGVTRGQIMTEWTSAGSAIRTAAEVSGGTRTLGLRASGGYRRAAEYYAADGRFGGIRVTGRARVLDSGVQDGSARAELRWLVRDGHELFARHEHYRAGDTGFGFFADAYAPAAPTVRITVPDQQFTRTVAGWSARTPRWPLAQRLDLTFHHQTNERDFSTLVHSPLPAPAGAVMDISSVNFTSLETMAVRLEAARTAGVHVLTYGLELTRERSINTDTSTTITTLPAQPPLVTGRGGSSVPDALLWNLGVFAQSALEPSARAQVILGLRYQHTRSEPRATAGYGEELKVLDEGTLVGAANLLLRVSPRLHAVASAARGFRSPNLIERFFAGNTPEGRGFWLINPQLKPETSLNLDVGLRYRSDRTQAEVFLFRTRLHDGIVLEPTGDTVGRRTVYRNVNVDRLQYRGLEASTGLHLLTGWTVMASFSLIEVADLRAPARTFAETYPYKALAALRYDRDGGPFWAEWSTRYTGRTPAPLPGVTAVGEHLPGFIVHDVRAGLRLGRQRLVLGVRNAGDRLYSETLNSGIFRPEPGRNFFVSFLASF